MYGNAWIEDDVTIWSNIDARSPIRFDVLDVWKWEKNFKCWHVFATYQSSEALKHIKF